MKKQNILTIVIIALLIVVAVLIYIFMGDKSISTQQTISTTSEDAPVASEVGEVIYNGVHFNIHSGLSTLKEFGEPTEYLRDVVQNDSSDPRTNKGTTYYYYTYAQTGQEDNYDIYITLCEDSGVTQVYDYIISSNKVSFVNGITIGSTLDEVVATMGEPTSFDDSRSMILYNYETGPVNMTFIFDKNRLYRVIVSNNAIVDKFCPD
ncbi:MAG: hypothetical protein K6D38_08470 [Pseudobutyrivibrio sp.]|nr:hypothetical protein [Pseudobutyrivibrio sp.]